jgi:hypothetical protein
MRKQWIVGLVLVSVLFSLSSCTSSNLIRLYDESTVKPEDVVRIAIPVDIDIVRVDDRNVGGGVGYLFAPGDMELQLAPGEHVLTVRYSDLWEYDDNNYDTFKSQRLSLMFDARAGGLYQLTHPPLENPKAMEAFAKDPDIWIEQVEAGGEKMSRGESEGVKVSQPVESGRLQRETDTGQPSPSQPEATLKADWDSLTEEEKALFREWLKSREKQ